MDKPNEYPQDCEYIPLFERYVLTYLPDAEYVNKQKEGGKKIG